MVSDLDLGETCSAAGDMDKETIPTQSDQCSDRADIEEEPDMWGVGRHQYGVKEVFGDFLYPRTNSEWASQVALVVKNPPANAGDPGDVGLIPGWRRSPAEGNSNPLQYSCLEIPMDRGAWRATVHGATKSRT